MRPLRREELARAAATLARAFHADPLFAYLLPEPQQRARWLQWLETWMIRVAFAGRGAFTLDDGPDLGAMGLIPPGRWPLSPWRSVRAMPVPSIWPTTRFVRDGSRILSWMQAHHPSGPHRYLYVVGVDPARKGQGLGGALLRHAAELADREGVPTYLETANPDNLGLYRRFGFEVDGELALPNVPTLWTMTRPPAGGWPKAPPRAANRTRQ